MFLCRNILKQPSHDYLYDQPTQGYRMIETSLRLADSKDKEIPLVKLHTYPLKYMFYNICHFLRLKTFENCKIK